MTYKKAENLRDALKRLPIESIIFETDSPYLTPLPHRGKPNRPGYVLDIYNYASQILGTEIEVLKNKVWDTLRKIFPNFY